MLVTQCSANGSWIEPLSGGSLLVHEAGAVAPWILEQLSALPNAVSARTTVFERAARRLRTGRSQNLIRAHWAPAEITLPSLDLLSRLGTKAISNVDVSETILHFLSDAEDLGPFLLELGHPSSGVRPELEAITGESFCSTFSVEHLRLWVRPKHVLTQASLQELEEVISSWSRSAPASSLASLGDTPLVSIERVQIAAQAKRIASSNPQIATIESEEKRIAAELAKAKSEIDIEALAARLRAKVEMRKSLLALPENKPRYTARAFGPGLRVVFRLRENADRDLAALLAGLATFSETSAPLLRVVLA